MAFSGSSYFAGIGTTLAAIAFGVACGSMVTTSVVQPPNRLERLKSGTSGTTVGSNSRPTDQVAPSAAEKSDRTKPAPPSAATATVAAPSDPQPAQQPQPAVAESNIKSDVATSAQPQPAPTASKPANAAPAPLAKGEDPTLSREDTASAKTERASTRPADSSREISHRRAQRKSSDDHRFSERKRRQDEDPRQQNLDAAANVVRQMPRGNAVGEVVDRDDSPRFARPRHFEMDDDGPPRLISEPPPRFFGLFGD